MHQASGAGKRKSPKRFSLLTSVLIGDTEVNSEVGIRVPQVPHPFRASMSPRAPR